MLRGQRAETEIPFLIERLRATGEGAPAAEEKLRLVQQIRGHSAEAGRQVDRFFVDHLAELHGRLADASAAQEKLGAILERLAAPPWHPALFLGLVPTDGRPANALVQQGSARRVVSVAEELDPEALRPGDEVFLGSELNVIVANAPAGLRESGETALFDRLTPDGRLVLRSRDEELIVSAAAALDAGALTGGDLVRWDRDAWMAFEKVERSSGEDLFLEGTPAESFEQVGGLGPQIEAVQRAVGLHMSHAEVARRYRLRRKGSVLLVGPPGTGKTMMARALANWLARASRSGRSRFINVKPAGLHSEWYGRTEANYREAFRAARAAGEQEPDVPVVMFFDEVDSVGAARGTAHMRVDDRVLTAFMTELDGLESRGNVLVVAATNRRDALDPALLRPGRLGDLVVEVPRPNMRAARDILAKYLTPDMPYRAGGGADQEEARRLAIDSTVSRIYAPNGEGELATLTLRDGRKLPVRAPDLVSGACLAKIAGAAAERAFVREVEGGEPGVAAEDLWAEAADEFESLARALAPHNCRQHLAGLPQDVEVVRVEPLRRKVARPHTYLNAAA